MTTKRITVEEWAKDEEAEFGGNGPLDYSYDVQKFVDELKAHGVKSAEVHLYDSGRPDGELYLEVSDFISKDLLVAIVESQPDECGIEEDGFVRIWWD